MSTAAVPLDAARFTRLRAAFLSLALGTAVVLSGAGLAEGSAPAVSGPDRPPRCAVEAIPRRCALPQRAGETVGPAAGPHRLHAGRGGPALLCAQRRGLPRRGAGGARCGDVRAFLIRCVHYHPAACEDQQSAVAAECVDEAARDASGTTTGDDVEQGSHP